MRTLLAALNCLLIVVTIAGVGNVATTAVAQERRYGRDDDDRDSDRRERRSFRRDRSDDDDDDRGGREERRESSTSREASSSSSSDGGSMNMTDYAKGLVKQHDKNGNMMLEGEEIKQLRGRAALADANNDNVVTVDELVAKLGSPSTSSTPVAASSSATSSSSNSDDDEQEERGSRSEDRGGWFGSRRGDRDSDRGRSESGSASGGAKRVYLGTVSVGAGAGDEKNARKTYRFKSSADRMPTGLPSWFKSRDKNGDGQVLMSEYSRSWSSRMVSEFGRYDTNGDGVITPKEAEGK